VSRSCPALPSALPCPALPCPAKCPALLCLVPCPAKCSALPSALPCPAKCPALRQYCHVLCLGWVLSVHVCKSACLCVCMRACGFAIHLCCVEPCQLLRRRQALAVSLDADKLFTSNPAQRQPMSQSSVFNVSTTAIY